MLVLLKFVAPVQNDEDCWPTYGPSDGHCRFTRTPDNLARLPVQTYQVSHLDLRNQSPTKLTPTSPKYIKQLFLSCAVSRTGGLRVALAGGLA